MVSFFHFFLALSFFALLSCGGGVGENLNAVQSETNHPPFAVAGPDQNVSVGSVVTLDGSGSYDPDNDSFSYKWELMQVPNGSTAILSDPNAVRPTFIPNVSGAYVAKLVVQSKSETGPAFNVDSLQHTVSDASYVTVMASTTLRLPRPPLNVSAIAGDGHVLIRWSSQEIDGAVTSYNIYWSATAGVTKKNGIKISNASNPHNHKDLTNDKTYYYVVTGVNEYGESDTSPEVSATPSPAVPSAPAGLIVTASDLKATISWNAVDNATAYNIYWSTSPDVSRQSGTKVVNVKSPYVLSGLIQGKTYYCVVTAVNGYGESVDSTKASVTIPSYLNDIFVAMGGSITKGYLLNNYDDCYVARLSRKWGKTAVNKGVNGATSVDGKSLIGSILSEYNPQYVTIYYGSNDIGYYNIELIVNNLRYIIGKAKENGTIPVVATLGPFLGQWAWKQPFSKDLNKRIRQMAAEMGVAFADLEAALNGNSAYMNADGMHPNSAGHQIIADAFYKALTQ